MARNKRQAANQATIIGTPGANRRSAAGYVPPNRRNNGNQDSSTQETAAPQQYLPPTTHQLNASAPAFTPINQDIIQHSQARPAPVPAAPIHEKKKPGKTKRQKQLEKFAALAEKDQNQTSPTDHWTRAPVPDRDFSDVQVHKNQEQVASPHPTKKPAGGKKFDPRKTKRVMFRQPPVPTPMYMQYATQPPQTLEISRPLLIILDLNGTMLHRKKFGGSNEFVARPHVHEFLEYLFNNHRVMVWSSSKPPNVAKMCSDLFTSEQRSKLAAVWARDTLQIPPEHYNTKVQTYKQLSWVWNNPHVQASNPVPGGVWTQANTVLIDDSLEKAASEPHNLVELEEFEAKEAQMSTDVLGQVALYLDDLRSQQDVSAYMRLHPFKYDPKPPAGGQKKRDTPMEM